MQLQNIFNSLLFNQILKRAILCGKLCNLSNNVINNSFVSTT